MRPSSVFFICLGSQRKESPWVLFPACSLAAPLRVPPWGCPPPTNCNPSGRCWQVWMTTPLFLRTHSHWRMPRYVGQHWQPSPLSIISSLSGFRVSLWEGTRGHNPQMHLISCDFCSNTLSLLCTMYHILTYKKFAAFLWFAFSFLCCPQGLMQPAVVNVARHGTELGGHVAK